MNRRDDNVVILKLNLWRLDNVVKWTYKRGVQSRRPTLKDVAAAADVSFKTVSRVVNGESGVSSELSERVDAAVEQLGYRRNHNARRLRHSDKRGGTIGVVHADIANPFAAAVHASFEMAASEHDVLLLSGSASEDSLRQDALIDAFTERQVDGLVVIPCAEPPGPALQRELARGLPIVFVDRDPGVMADVVLSDHRAGAVLATSHLLDHGHRKIAFIGSKGDVDSVRLRRLGFDSVMNDCKGATSVHRSDLASVDQAAAGVRELFANRGAAPSAIFAAQNQAAIGALRALHELGLQHEVALVAFDSLDVADIVEPGITTVPQDAALLGRTAAAMLFDRISGSNQAVRRHVVPVQLIARGSGEIVASRSVC